MKNFEIGVVGGGNVPSKPESNGENGTISEREKNLVIKQQLIDKISGKAKEAVNADGIYLMQMIELVRKSLGYKEDIDSAILRLRGSADHYGSLLSRKYREER